MEKGVPRRDRPLYHRAVPPRPAPRSSRLAYLAPALLAVVATAQFAIAHATPLSPWKLGGFGMFSTGDVPRSRVLRVRLQTETGAFVVPGPRGPLATRAWPREDDLRAAARGAVCASWRLIPFDSVDAGGWPAPEWEGFYTSDLVREQTQAVGIAVPSPGGEGAAVGAAQAEVLWLRLDPSDATVVVPVSVAAETVERGGAGCP